MRVEDFDSKLRQKISHIEPDFQEKDWLRFQQRLQAGARRPWKRYLLLLLLLISVGGIAYTYWMQMPEGAQKVSKLNPVILANKPEANATLEQPVVSDPVRSESFRDSGPNHQSEAKSTIGKKVKSLDRKKNIDRNDLVHNSVDQSAAPHSNNNAIQDSQEPLENNVVLMENHSENVSGLQAELWTQKLQLISPATLISEKNDATVQPDLKILKHGRITKWTAGLSLIAAKEHASFGVLVERKTNSNISFRSGMLYQNFFEKEYQNDIDFKEDNQVAFTEIAKPRHSTSESFSNIRIKSSEVVCPLELKYTIPLSSKTAAFVFGGVQLTVQSKTVLDFDYLNHFTNQYLSENGLDQAANSSTLINNFGLGAGIQRSFGGLQWSVAGVLQKSNSNLPHIAKNTWGLQGGVSFVF